MNLRDSGVEVFIGLRAQSQSKSIALKSGFKVFDIDQESIAGKYCAILTPDHTHKDLLIKLSVHNENIICIYAHGYSMVKDKLSFAFPSFEHILLAPKSIASELRFRYETKENLTAFYSLEYSNLEQLDIIKKLANLLGINNLYPTNFEEEMKADLFSEQSILCSLLPYGINEAYQTLIEQGYSKEIAFFECFYESKLILDTIFKMGPKSFFELISPNALIGSQVGKELLFDEQFKKKLKALLLNIENQNFHQTIDNTNIEDLKVQVSNFWQKQDLNNTYNGLKESL